MPEPAQLSRIAELYYDALELPEAEREAFLANACAGDAALQREVASLLTARAEAAGFLSRSVLEPSLLGGEQRPNLTARLGSTIDHYQLLSVLGVGGMGEVFLAEDTRLHRQVALKLLPAEFSQNPQRIHRFEQEARATTALNHPNIVTLHDTGQHEDAYYLVTEFVDGQTLREHLNERGALPISEALNLAQQIATALSAAHAAGIVHRDIKPENVMLRRDGFVKVLDFGLAKLTDTLVEFAVAQDETHEEETPHAALNTPHSQTAAGALLGTIRYMSPEQARGETVDARTDVFSLGVVLYEMLTNQHPFARATATQTMAAILEAEPPALPASTPVALQRLITNALHKGRAQRTQTTAEMAAGLRQLVEETQFSARLANEPRWQRLVRRFPLWATALAILAALAFGAYVISKPSNRFETEVLPNLKYSFVDSWKTEPGHISQEVLSSSPDAKQVAFSKLNQGQSDIFTRLVAGGELKNLTKDVWFDFSPIFSPDGKSLAYLSIRNEGKAEVWQIPLTDDGGEKRRIASLDFVPLWLTNWTRDGQLIYYEWNRNLYELGIVTGQSRAITNNSTGSTQEIFAVSTDNQWTVYTEKTANITQLFVKPLSGGTPRQITHEGESNSNAQWLPDNERILYSSVRGGVQQICLAFRDGRSPIQITFGLEWVVPWEVSYDGSKVFYFSEQQSCELSLLNLVNGKTRNLATETLDKIFPAFSSDSQRLAFQQVPTWKDTYDNVLYQMPLTGGSPVRLTDHGFDVHWSPRGDQLAFLRVEGTHHQLWTVGRDGGEPRLIVKDDVSFLGYSLRPYGWVAPPNYSWSPDGARLVYGSIRNGLSNLYASAIDGSGETIITNNTEKQWRFFSPIYSPTGKQLIYLGRASAQGERLRRVYLQEGAQQRVLFQTADEMRLLGWTPSGTHIYVAVIAAKNIVHPTEARVLKLSTLSDADNSQAVPVARFAETYWHSLTLAPDEERVSYIARHDNTDNLWIASLVNGHSRRLTNNADPTLSLGCLAWAPQSHQVAFTKQSHTTSIRMIEGFK